MEAAVIGHRRLPLRLWVAAMVLAAGCGGLFRHPAPAEDVDFAKAYLALFPARALPAIEMGMDPALKDPQMRAKIAKMAILFPPGPPTSIRVAGSTSTTTGTDTTSTLTLEYEYPDRWLLANVVIGRHNHASVIKGVQVQPLKESLERLNRVTFAGKTPVHALALAVALLVLLFVLGTFLVAARTPAPGMKWAWAALVLVGVVRFSFNWTTGMLSMVPMSLQLLGSNFSKPSAFEPFVVSTSIPVGAIVYLLQRRDWRRETGAPPPDVSPGPDLL
jgi:hypothetical protein